MGTILTVRAWEAPQTEFNLSELILATSQPGILGRQKKKKTESQVHFDFGTNLSHLWCGPAQSRALAPVCWEWSLSGHPQVWQLWRDLSLGPLEPDTMVWSAWEPAWTPQSYINSVPLFLGFMPGTCCETAVFGGAIHCSQH